MATATGIIGRSEGRRGLASTIRRVKIRNDGRSFGGSVAINQLASVGRPIRLASIEGPETALHPAVGTSMDAFRDAAGHTQVPVTTHGADPLDRLDPEEDHILAVDYREGRAEVGPIDSRQSGRDPRAPVFRGRMAPHGSTLSSPAGSRAASLNPGERGERAAVRVRP